MSRVLLIDDDAAALQTFGHLLRLAGHDVAAAESPEDVMVIAATFDPDVAIIDLRIAHSSGLDVLREMRRQHPQTACVMMSGFATLQVAVEAMRLGAMDFLEKPVFDEDLLNAIGRVHRSDLVEIGSTECEAHSRKRWAELVVALIAAPRDPRTLSEWGRLVGISTGGLRNWCRTARLSARRSLLFARVLRAIARYRRAPMPVEDLLDIVDRRTLSKLLLASGGTAERLPQTLDEFLTRQHLVDDPAAVREVRAKLVTFQTRAAAPRPEPLEQPAPTGFVAAAAASEEHREP